MHTFSLVFIVTALLLFTFLNCVETGDENETAFVELPCVQLHSEGNATAFANIPSKTKLCVIVSYIPTKMRFLVVEAHSQRYNITLSNVDANFPSEIFSSPSDFVEGTGVGLVSFTDYLFIKTFWVFNNNENNVGVMLSAEFYHDEDPIPGGCNMEFPVEISPFLRLGLKNGSTLVEFQHANVGYGPFEPVPTCSYSSSFLSYQIYLYFLNENEFDEDQLFTGLQRMRNVNSIKKYGKLLEPYKKSPKTRMTFITYKGQGVIFNIIVKYKMNNTTYESAYVPISTYGCSFTSQIDGCGYLTGSFAKFLVLFMAVFGFFIATRGHRFLTIEMGFFGFLAFSLISYVILTKYTSTPAPDRDVFTMLCGIGGGIAWGLIWYFFGIPVVSVLLVGFCLGFLLTAVLFFTPLGNFTLLHNDFNYWMLFSCGVLIVPVIFMSTTKFLNILSCSVVGTYCTIIAVDRYLRSSLSYIILNVVKRTIIEDFNEASNEVPFQKTDIVLSSVWAVLTVVAVGIQILCERGRPPFPPAPVVTRLRQLELRRQRSQARRYVRTREILTTNEGTGYDEDERAPLLSESNQGSYYNSDRLS